mmetsp:Transcript_93572/g.166474  ORF Transcript_93572/g.166474 Transcript_93572/m.166474 type:complete len:216 (-) Transcript_93572:62-709(-)
MERSAGKVTAKALSPRSSTAALVKVSSSFCASQSASRSFDQEVKPRSKEIVSTAGQWRDATTAWAAPKTSPARRLRKWCSLILGASWFPASEVIGKQQSWAAAAGEAASQCSTSGAARNGGTALPISCPSAEEAKRRRRSSRRNLQRRCSWHPSLARSSAICLFSSSTLFRSWTSRVSSSESSNQRTPGKLTASPTALTVFGLSSQRTKSKSSKL